MLKQAARRGRGVSTPADVQNLTGHGPEQPALGQGDLRSCLPATLWFCDVFSL